MMGICTLVTDADDEVDIVVVVSVCKIEGT